LKQNGNKWQAQYLLTAYVPARYAIIIWPWIA
jgi:hypothetical protein